MNLTEALRCGRTLAAQVLEELSAQRELAELGLAVNGFALLRIAANPETARALEAQAREEILKQADDALEARELIKGKVLENSLYTAREAAEELSRLTRSEVVQVIGSKFVLYRFQHNREKRRIELVRDRKKSV